MKRISIGSALVVMALLFAAPTEAGARQHGFYGHGYGHGYGRHGFGPRGFGPPGYGFRGHGFRHGYDGYREYGGYRRGYGGRSFAPPPFYRPGPPGFYPRPRRYY